MMMDVNNSNVMEINTNRQTIDKILDRGVVTDVLPDKDTFRERLMSGDRLRFYIGVDPTADTLHLSHAKNYMLLEEFRRLGHEVIVLFGDFTARIGDPTERSSARKQLDSEQIKHNVAAWRKQIEPLMDFDSSDNPPLIKYNSDWLASLSFGDIIELASNFTVQQMIERDMFQQRMESEQPIYMHEFFYPLMQGYDSVAMEVDVELCGTDQIFNAMSGRTLSKRLIDKDKHVVAVNLMENPDTGELMSKSRGSGVFLNSSANDMYGAIMAQPDAMIEVLLINNTRLELREVERIVQDSPPREAKARVAYEVVSIFYGQDAAQSAEDAFNSQFQRGELPDDIHTKELEGAHWQTADLLLEVGLVDSKTEGRRVLEQGGVKLNGEMIDSLDMQLADNDVVQVGKRKFVRVALK